MILTPHDDQNGTGTEEERMPLTARLQQMMSQHHHQQHNTQDGHVAEIHYGGPAAAAAAAGDELYYDSNQEMMQQLQLHAPLDINMQQTHNFHYGNTDYHDPFVMDPYSRDSDFPNDRYPAGGSSLFCRFCCCWGRIWKLFLDRIILAEDVQRSFCFAGIDGMLTGSGIVAACVGLGLTIVTPHDHHAPAFWNQWILVALTLAACASDAVCMAIGHVWSTYAACTTSSHERQAERDNFANHRSDAKGKLVDMLLERGMLKIDAMSVADTLEGYPDIFVSALVGDSGYVLGNPHDTDSDNPATSGTLFSKGHSPNIDNISNEHHSPPGRRQMGQHRTYGQFDEAKDDPESASKTIILTESRNEAIVMMTSFILFSILPSLLYTNIMRWTSGDEHNQSDSISSTTLVLLICSLIMIFLGTWKR
jgi:hypothetical protein